MRPPEGAKGQHWINFIHLGRKFYNLVLWSNSQLGQRKWLENIYQQQQAMRERSTIFETVTLCEGFFTGVNKVNCVAPLSGGRRMAYGTDDGIYISDLRDMSKDPVKVLALLEVMQIDVLEAYQLLIILSGTCPVVLGNALLGLTALLERSVFTVPLDALDPMDPNAGIKRAKRISSHTSFFKAGYCLGKMLVCIVKSTQLSSTFKTLEPIDQNVRGRSKPTFKKLINGGNDTLKLFRVGIFSLLGLEYADFMLRNFTYRSSLHRYITSRRKCVLDAPRALRLWTSRHWIPRDFWILVMSLWNLFEEGRV